MMQTADKKPENIHKNHRKRLKERFNAVGFKGWSKHEILEYFLYYVVAQGDKNPLAHALMNFSGNSFKNLFENSSDDRMIKSIKGVGPEYVLFLRSIKAFFDYYRMTELSDEMVHLNRDNIRSVCDLLGISKNTEDIFMICMDRALGVKSVINITEDSGASYATTSINRIVKYAAKSGVKNVLLIHNHPSGSKEISDGDIDITKRVGKLLSMFNIFLVDHYIICGDDFVSIRMTKKI